MSEARSKLYSVGEIVLALFYCFVISIFIYAASVFYIFGAWHCPDGNCRTPFWTNALVFVILAAPVFIFPLGAYFARNAIRGLTGSKTLRIAIFTVFASLPVLVLCGFIAYIALSKN